MNTTLLQRAKTLTKTEWLCFILLSPTYVLVWLLLLMGAMVQQSKSAFDKLFPR